MGKTRAQIRKMVLQLLNEGNITEAPVSVERIAEMVGATIQKLDLKENLSGFSYPEGENKTIGVNLRDAPLRQRFTIAHELGHLLMHKEKLEYDRGFAVQFRDDVASEGSSLKEIEANFFAAELLMPKVMLEKDLAGWGQVDIEQESNELDQLAERYQVSRQAMTVRLANIGHLRF